MAALFFLIAGAVGLYAFSVDEVRSSGTVQIKAGVPYRFFLVWPRMYSDDGASFGLTPAAQAQMLEALGLTGKAPVVRQSSLGTEITYDMTPPVTAAITLNTPIAGQARLRSITRMDGRDWNAP